MSALTLAEAKAHLNIQGTTDDAELQAVIDAAEARLSQIVGPLSSATVSKRIASSVSLLLLPVAPVLTLTSITAVNSGVAVDLSLVTFDAEVGIVYYTDGVTGFWSSSYDVVYDAGRLTCPADLLFAIKELVRHLWETQRGTPMTPDDTFDTPSVGYALPNRVLEMIAPYRQTVVG